MSPTADRAAFEAARLFDADADADADAGRLELLRWLADQGFGVDEMVEALHGGRLSALAGDRLLHGDPFLDHQEALTRTGLDDDGLDVVVRAFGLSELERSPDGDVGITEREATALAAFAEFGGLFTSQESLAFFRVIGSSLSRIADAAVSLFLSDVERRSIEAGETELELAHKIHQAVGLLDGLTASLDPILRRHVMHGIERSRQTTISTSERLVYRYAVGFVDLVGFTQVTASMPSDRLADLLRDFEARAHDAATEVGARVVKMIGDEVMFVAGDASAACATGAALMAGIGDEYDLAPRGAVAYGDVLVRGGDYYGAVVNLASRLASEAVPHELLVTEAVADAATDRSFEPAGRRMLKGFPSPVSVRSLVS